ncbi:MAG: hypothetical protein BGO99_01715 [Nitrosospira sp. 56-18]|nr:MAG: hypothetical protein BGO99_01715 [Nitrosospira sp. 56-18]
MDYDAKERNAVAPQSVARGAPRKRGSGSGEDASTAPQFCWGAGIPLRGRIFLSEDAAPPCAVAPFASSPFAHPLPQSHRRASGDLFSASLGYYYTGDKVMKIE